MQLPGKVLLLLLFVTSSVAFAEINSGMFQHHYITREMPGRNMGMGSPALADFDRDGDLDFAFLNRGDLKLYWFENQGAEKWKQHLVGQAAIGQLGSITTDVDGDGWTDIVIGGFWYRNPQQPLSEPFLRYTYDSTITREVHDMALADVDGDGGPDVVAMGDGDGCFWYRIPEEPGQDSDWPRTLITMDVLDSNVDIHAGLNSNGVGDLDGDGDADVMLTDR
ncbi:MAG TPA: VCBS repeat-containing protein, partial [Acidobacteriota bacterium]|nr:VCBS repeat-containing protein [Acidobacteriota bacterium]